MRLNHELPGLTVLMAAYRADKTIRSAIESVDRVLRGHKWALVICVDGQVDDTARIAKETVVSARRVHIEVFPKALTIHQAFNRCTPFAWALRHEYPWFTFHDADDEMLPDRITLLREAVRHGHQVLVGGCLGQDIPTGQNFQYQPDAGFDQNRFSHGLAVCHTEVLRETRAICQDLPNNVPTDVPCWHAMRRRGIRIGYWPGLHVQLYRSDTTGHLRAGDSAEQKMRNLQPWLDQNPLRRPQALGIVASGMRSSLEAVTAIRSFRLHHPGIWITVAGDQVARKILAPRVQEFMDLSRISTSADLAIQSYRGNEANRNTFRFATMKLQLARLLACHGDTLIADSDMLFTRPLPCMPPDPASTIEPNSWVQSGAYVGANHWGLTSAGLLWFPAGSGAFLNHYEQETLKNCMAFSVESLAGNELGNGRFCEQGGFDSMLPHYSLDSLPPGNNLTPACVRSFDQYLSCFSGRHLLDEARRTIGLASSHGLWWRGWPVRSVHVHFGTQVWCCSFERIVTTALQEIPDQALAHCVPGLAGPGPAPST